MTAQSNLAWNVFAGELERVLLAHGYRLGHLDDRLHIHKETVRRLQLSLTAANAFPLLNPDDLDAVIRFLGLQGSEKVHLRAAMLATALEAKLMDRIPALAARDAAYMLLPLIEQALIKQFGADDDTIRLDDESAPSDFERQFGLAIEAVECGALAQYLSDTAHSRLEQESALREAFSTYCLARDLLQQAEESNRDDTWQYWFNRAEEGAKRAH